MRRGYPSAPIGQAVCFVLKHAIRQRNRPNHRFCLGEDHANSVKEWLPLATGHSKLVSNDLKSFVIAMNEIPKLA
jgi:hypothetical protein